MAGFVECDLEGHGIEIMLGFRLRARHYRLMNSSITSYDSVWIVGCGDIGRRVAALWRGQANEIIGIVSCEPSARLLNRVGISSAQCNLDDLEPVLPELQASTLVYYFIPPPSSGVIDHRCQHFLASLAIQLVKPKRIIAISTTGVYGDCAGDLIGEDQPVKPKADRAKRRFDMESQLKVWCERNNVPLIILRVGGIYGPRRLPLNRIKQGVPVLKEALAPKTNRIHEDDLAQVCVAAAHSQHDFRIYNVSDGTDSNMTEYFFTLADHFGLKRPPALEWEQAEQEISKGMLSYLKESRRIDNSRMLAELDIKLRYPNLEAALEEIKKD